METRELVVEIRNISGKGNARQLRDENKVPGVFYGPHLRNAVSISILDEEVSKAMQSKENTLFTLKSDHNDSINGKMALVRETQLHPVTDRVLHVDLYEVRMEEKIRVNVPLILIGKSIGIAEGGLLQQSLRELEVRCLPRDIPEKIEVDITSLGIGHSLHVSDLVFPSGVVSTSAVNYTVVAIVPPEAEVTETPAVVPGTEGAPEVAVSGATATDDKTQQASAAASKEETGKEKPGKEKGGKEKPGKEK